MTVIARRNSSHDRIPPPDGDTGPDPVAARLRRRHWMVMTLAVLLLAGVVRAAAYLTALSPVAAGAATSAAVDPWGPHPLGTRPWQLARLLSSEQPEAAERVAPAALPASPILPDTALRPAAIPAAARTAGIAVSPQSASP
ncbi:hypothetical protein [Azospirillum largimobile]